MSQALALLALTLHSTVTGDPVGYEMAHLLDNHVLLHLANASILTGIMLSAMTRWGLASVIAFQAWLSVAKPWKRTPWAKAWLDVPTPAKWVVSLTLLAPLLDLLLAEVVFGNPAPLFAALTAIGYPIWRQIRVTRARPRPVS
ncbi:hypothetical protein OHA25_17650 [Nonomuraea sp. NBC_00507]|uniref:hypothetical protein n=1 Tax=Nonomuraea sp. NBC_00507 TaxID=2976002 RepID=UPI002E18BFF8